MKKVTVVVALVLIVLFAFAACTATQEVVDQAAEQAQEAADAAAAADAPATEAAPEEVAEPAADGGSTDGLIVGYNAGSDSIEFFTNVYGGMKSQAEKNGVELLYTVSNFDPEQIIPSIENLMMQGANVIVDFNVNSEIGGNIVDVVKEKGGKGTISIDVEYFNAAGTDQAWFMGINNQRAGELCGEAIADYVVANKDGKLEKLVLFYNSENGDEVKKRMGGAIDGLKNKGIELTEDQIEWIDMGGGGSDTTLQGKDKFAAWLTANPDVKSVGVVCVNDETTQGTFAAAETANRTQDCIFASHNVSQQYIEVAKKGGAPMWVGSVAYHPEKYGEYIIPLAMDIYSGVNTDPTVKTVMEPEFVPQDQVEKYEADYAAYTSDWK